MPASRNSLDQRAISSPADLNFPQLLLQQGAECSGSSGFSFISDCCPSLSPRREKSALTVLIGLPLRIEKRSPFQTLQRFQWFVRRSRSRAGGTIRSNWQNRCWFVEPKIVASVISDR